MTPGGGSGVVIAKTEERICCAWRPDDDGNWETGCDEMHIFLDGSPSENKHKYCPYCGLEILEVLPGWPE